MPPRGSGLLRTCFVRPGCLSETRSFTFFLSCAALSVALAGCDRAAQVVVERVPKDKTRTQAPTPPTAQAERMLGAMIVGDKKALFFKLTGPPENLDAYREPFLDLVKSAEVGDPSTWTVPKAWKETPEGGMRLATITIPDEPSLEFSVTSLPLTMENKDRYRLANVNRWRRQLSLPPIELGELRKDTGDADTIFQLPLANGGEATVVDFLGTSQGGGMMAPFASMAASDRGGMPAGGPPPADKPDSGLTYEKPDGWKTAAGTAFSQAAFTVGEARVTISALSATNDIFANVNRWRGQVGLEPIPKEELNDRTETITLGDGQEGVYAVLNGTDGKSMLGVIAKRGEKMWFVKMVGDNATIAKEKPQFEDFVKSLHFKE